MSSKYILSLIIIPVPIIIGSALNIINIGLPYAIGIGILGWVIGIILAK